MGARVLLINIPELSSNPIALALKTQQLKAVYLWRIYPPKLSNIIMSSSTPSEWSKSSTVFAIIGGPRRKWLARRNSHASLACRTSSSPQKLKIFGGPAYYGYLCGASPMKKTILDLLHSNESKRNIVYDNFGNQ